LPSQQCGRHGPANLPHLPLHRQEEIFRRQGGELPRQKMCDWMRACADLVSPLYELMKQRLLASKAVQTDDTLVPVLDPDRAGEPDRHLEKAGPGSVHLPT
jgi:transposase